MEDPRLETIWEDDRPTLRIASPTYCPMLNSHVPCARPTRAASSASSESKTPLPRATVGSKRPRFELIWDICYNLDYLDRMLKQTKDLTRELYDLLKGENYFEDMSDQTVVELLCHEDSDDIV